MLDSKTSSEVTAQKPRPILLILIHGILTDAPWQEQLVARFASDESVAVVPIKYGYFDVVRFFLPFFTRDSAVRRINFEIQNALKEYPNHKTIVLAHSFGTYALSKVLLNNPLIHFDRVILCGAIVPKRFPWNDIADQIGERGEPLRKFVINECGSKDIWPILAQSMTYGFGNSGTFGFGSTDVTDRYHNVSHSEYFKQPFVDKYWMPLIGKDRVERTEWEQQRGVTPWYQQLLRLPFNYIFTLVLGAFLALLGIALYDSLRDLNSVYVEHRNCGARILYPSATYRETTLEAVPTSGQGPGLKVLQHRNGRADIRLHAWFETEQTTPKAIIEALSREHNRSVTYIAPFFVASGFRNSVHQGDTVYYYRFREFERGTTRIVKMFEHEYPSDPSTKTYFDNLNELVSRTILDDGTSLAVRDDCRWPHLAQLLAMDK